jgi:uncharacterized membrane protein YgaE (UPF0421/DUF939 family)
VIEIALVILALAAACRLAPDFMREVWRVTKVTVGVVIALAIVFMAIGSMHAPVKVETTHIEDRR